MFASVCTVMGVGAGAQPRSDCRGEEEGGCVAGHQGIQEGHLWLAVGALPWRHAGAARPLVPFPRVPFPCILLSVASPLHSFPLAPLHPCPSTLPPAPFLCSSRINPAIALSVHTQWCTLVPSCLVIPVITARLAHTQQVPGINTAYL